MKRAGISQLILFTSLAVLVVATDARSDPITIEQIVVVPSLSSQTADFVLTFSSPPDLATTVGFQFFVDTKEWLPDLRRFYDAVRGLYPSDGLHIITSSSSGVIIRDIEAFYPGSPGWGPVVGTAPLVQSGPVVAFTVPLALLDATDGAFYFGLDVGESGRWLPPTVFGQASVPDTGFTLLLFGIGLAGIATLNRRTRSTSRTRPLSASAG